MRRAAARQGGFTLIELLLVIGIIGIIVGVLSWNLLRGLRAAELRDATAQFATDLRRARSGAQRDSLNVTVSWPASLGPVGSYTVGDRTVLLPNGVTLQCVSGCGATPASNAVVYTAPYGEQGNATGKVLTLRSPYEGVTPLSVRVVGVTGKVIVAKEGN